ILCELYLIAFLQKDVCLFAAGGLSLAVGAARHPALARDARQRHFAGLYFVDLVYGLGDLLFRGACRHVKGVCPLLCKVSSLFGDAGRYEDVSGVLVHIIILLFYRAYRRRPWGQLSPGTWRRGWRAGSDCAPPPPRCCRSSES